MKLKESLGRDLWIQNLTLEIDTVAIASQETRDLSQETQDLPQETHDQTTQMLLTKCSLAKLSLAKPSLAEPSRDQLVEYDWWI